MTINSQFKCKVCGENHEGTIHHAKEMMFGLRETFTYFQCAFCECLQISEIPLNISNYYPQDYYSFAPYDGYRYKGIPGKYYTARIKSTLFAETLLQKAINFINPVLKLKIFNGIINYDSRILDVGCGNGDMFLYPFKEVGINNVMGCDPFIPYDINYQNGLKIIKKDVSQIDGKWDVIIYNHSFEHVPNPQENLKCVSELLTSKGVCILRIPTVPNYCWTTYQTNWAQLDAPRHLFLHSPKSISILASNVGLTCEKILYDSTFFQFSGSEAISKGIPLLKMKENSEPFLIRKYKRWKYERLAKQLNSKNLGDQATFFLYKT